MTSASNHLNLDKLIFPNPSKDGLFYLPNEMEFKVFSITGELMLQSNSQKVDLTTYPSGVYILQTDYSNSRLIKY